jgi:hypothetical protein
MAMGRNTVVPDGVMNWYDAPMPQALVTFDVTGYNLPLSDVALTGLEKGDLLGYGVDLSGYYQSPYYLVEVPSSMWIPPYGYEWNSWLGVDGPYEFWDDLEVRSFDDEPIVENVLDVEVYSDNHGIAAVTAVAPDRAGSITITATADFPDRFLKGKYGPLTSEDIEITWGLIEFDPDFIGVPRVCDEVEGCEVTFTNLTTGATKPYKTATWDFGDGTDPVVQSGAQAQTGQTVTHTYAKKGIFDITLTMKDADDVVAFQVELDYIEVGEGGVTPVDYVTWTFNFDGFVPRCLDADYKGKTFLANLDPASIPASVQGVYYEDGTFWAPGAPGTTLTYLGGDQDPMCYSIAVIPTPASWTIPLMP